MGSRRWAMGPGRLVVSGAITTLEGCGSAGGMYTVLSAEKVHGSALGVRAAAGRVHEGQSSGTMQLCPTAPPRLSWKRAAHQLLLGLNRGEGDSTAPRPVSHHMQTSPEMYTWQFPLKECFFKGSEKIQVCWSQHSSSLVSLVGIKLWGPGIILEVGEKEQ